MGEDKCILFRYKIPKYKYQIIFWESESDVPSLVTQQLESKEISFLLSKESAALLNDICLTFANLIGPKVPRDFNPSYIVQLSSVIIQYICHLHPGEFNYL